MPDQPPLREAALLAQGALKQQWAYDAWPALCHLYAGAVLQLRSESPKIRVPLQSLVEKDLYCEATKPFLAFNEINGVLEELLAVNESSRISGMALDLIAHLGPSVFSKVSYLLTLRQELTRGHEHDPCISGHIGATPFRLVPAFLGGGPSFVEEPLKHRLMSQYPEDGYAGQHDKVLPRYVRVLSGASLKRSMVFYLEAVDPQANRKLAENYESRGLVMGALSLHRELSMTVLTIGGDAEAEVFRFQEPDRQGWPQGWEQHLQEALKLCCRHQVCVALLPELVGSPRVREACERAMSMEKMEFPVLLLAGSWHTDEGKVFRNRLHVYTFSGQDGLTEICTHDKFSHFEFKRYVEGNKTDQSGFTYIVTSIGILALGICRDWFFFAQMNGGARYIEDISQVVPTICAAPSMTSHVGDLKHVITDFFRRERSIFLFSNACGQIQHFGDGACCAEGEEDLRSFVAAPEKWFILEPLNHAELERLHPDGDVAAIRSCCKSQRTGDNTALARVRLKAE